LCTGERVIIEQSRVGDYRRTAAMLRRMAEQMCFGDSREQLMAVAANFEKLADRVEVRETATADALV